MGEMDKQGESAKIVDLFERVLVEKFDVTRYHEANLLDETGWYENLSMRRTAMDSSAGEGSPIDWGSWFFQTLEKPIRRRRIDESAKAKAVEDVGLVSAWEMRTTIERDPVAKASCEAWERSMNTVREIDPTLEIGSAEWMAEIRRREEEETDDKWFSSFNDVSGTVYPDNSLVYTEINLAAPDDVLISAFRSWLKSKREDSKHMHSPVRKFTESDFSRWAQKRVLAYMDLTIGAKWFGVTIPFHRLGDLLFPEYDNIDVAEKVRKTVAPLARELLVYEHLDALREAGNAKKWKEAEGI